MRLDKAVTFTGLSRSEAGKAIRAGRAAVNGAVVKDVSFRLSAGDTATLDGAEIDLREHRHIMLNKPAGVITATEDRHGDTTVIDILPEKLRFKGLGPIGRLDKDVTGLVILTTDGELAHRLISPKRDVEKIYLASVTGALDDNDVKYFEQGVELKDFTAKPARLEILSSSEGGSLARVYVSEGKFHQVKRMFLSAGHEVVKLERKQIATVKLDEMLETGECRFLTDEEADALYKSAGLERKE